jgi:hypothetical protein
MRKIVLLGMSYPWENYPYMWDEILRDLRDMKRELNRLSRDGKVYNVRGNVNRIKWESCLVCLQTEGKMK